MNIQNLIPWGRSGGSTEVARSEDQDPFLALHRDINRLFDETFRSFGLPGFRREAFGTTWPSVEVRDGEKEMRVVAEVPGLDASDVEILLSDNMLTLRGEKRAETSDAERGFSERYYGRFERRLPLPFEVEAEKVTADFENGVLTITLPKTEAAQRNVRRIAVTKKA